MAFDPQKDSPTPNGGHSSKSSELRFELFEESGLDPSFVHEVHRTLSDKKLHVYRRQVTGGYLADGTMPADGSMPAKIPTSITYFHGPASEMFGVSFSNLPVVNVRTEFDQYVALLKEPQFPVKLQTAREPIELPGMTWRGLPQNVLTYMLQRAILGIEACVSVAVEYELRAREQMTPEFQRALEDPFGIKGPRGTAEAFYNKLPALVDAAYKLEVKEPALWTRVQQFYKDIRNHVFHGYQLHNPTVDDVRPLFHLLGQVYAWLDSWSQAFSPKRP